VTGGGRQFLTERVDQFGVETEVVRRRAHADVEGVGIDNPLLAGVVIVSQRTVIEFDGDVTGLTRLQEDLLVTLELFDGAL
nr:hypothetical protein [Tanacetum cinerariifolium]